MTDEIRACLHEIASEEAEDLYEGAEGLWARKDQIPSDPSEFSEEEYEKLLSPERLEEINNGQQITVSADLTHPTRRRAKPKRPGKRARIGLPDCAQSSQR